MDSRREQRLHELKQMGVTRGWVLRITLVDGSIRRGPVYGVDDNWLMCVGAPIMDPDIVVKIERQ